MTAYVVGFYVVPAPDRPADAKVLLILKARPAWQKGKYNGVGGKVEAGETALEAMRREFREETGHADPVDWQPRVTMQGTDWRITFFVARGPFFVPRLDTDEPVVWVYVDALPPTVIPNLRWLIPLCLDPDIEPVTVTDSTVPGVTGMSAKRYY